MIKGQRFFDKKKIKITADLSDWGAGNWSDRIRKAVKLEVTTCQKSATVEIHIDLEDDFEKLALQIAKEAIEAFLNPASTGGAYYGRSPMALTKEGVMIYGNDHPLGSDSTLSGSIVIPWDELTMDGSDPRQVIRDWVEKEGEFYDPEPSGGTTRGGNG